MGSRPAPAPITYIPEPAAPTVFQSIVPEEDFARSTQYIQDLKTARETAKAKRYAEIGTPEEIRSRMDERNKLTKAAYKSSLPQPEIDYTAGLDPARLNNLDTFLSKLVERRQSKSGPTTSVSVPKVDNAKAVREAVQAPRKMSLSEISNKYGQFSTFGHRDYQAAKQEGYSDAEIKNYLDADMSRLHPDNRPGGSAGLYDEIKRGNVDLSKAVNIVR
jgi:hypothetical protein